MQGIKRFYLVWIVNFIEYFGIFIDSTLHIQQNANSLHYWKTRKFCECGWYIQAFFDRTLMVTTQKSYRAAKF